MDFFKFQCGDSVKDRVTGASGIISVRVEYRSGNLQYHVQPAKVKDGKPMEGFWIDEDALVLVKKSKLERAPREFKFSLGDEVHHIDSDHKGVVVSRTDHLYECTRYGVQPRDLNKDGKLFESLSHDEKSLVLDKVAAVPTRPRAETRAPEPPKRTGAMGDPPSELRRSGARG